IEYRFIAIIVGVQDRISVGIVFVQRSRVSAVLRLEALHRDGFSVLELVDGAFGQRTGNGSRQDAVATQRVIELMLVLPVMLAADRIPVTSVTEFRVAHGVERLACQGP